MSIDERLRSDMKNLAELTALDVREHPEDYPQNKCYGCAELGAYTERLLGEANRILLRINDHGDMRSLRKLIDEYEVRFEKRVAEAMLAFSE